MFRRIASHQPTRWLVENGPRELELLFRAIIYHPSAPILITDDEGNSRDASVGAGKLWACRARRSSAAPVDEFAQPGFKPQMSELWRALQEQGEQEGTLRLVGPDASPRDVEYTAKGNVLPVRHVLVLRDKTAPAANRMQADSDSVMGAGLCALLAGYRGPGCRLVFGSGAHLRLSAGRGYRPTRIFSLSRRRYSAGQTAGGIQARRGRRPRGNRRLAGEKRRVAILGQCHHDGAQR